MHRQNTAEVAPVPADHEAIMTLSRQQKIYIGIVSVAALALALDRTVFKPSAAVATSMDEYAVDATNESAADSAADALRAAEKSLANRLRTLSSERGIDPLQVRDVFDAKWTEALTEPAAPTADNSHALKFMQSHRLTAIMGTGSAGYAVIDGKCLRVNQAIDGYKLSAVTSRSAVLQSMESGEEFEYPLTLEPATDSLRLP
jgi:hypothetical protein